MAGGTSLKQLSCAALSGSTLALGTLQDGVALIDLNSHQIERISTNNGLQNKTVLSVAFDRDLEVCAQSQLGVCIIESLSIESTGASAPELNRNLYRLSLSNGISNTIVQAAPVFESKVEYILCLRVVIYT